MMCAEGYRKGNAPRSAPRIGLLTLVTKLMSLIAKSATILRLPSPSKRCENMFPFLAVQSAQNVPIRDAVAKYIPLSTVPTQSTPHPSPKIIHHNSFFSSPFKSTLTPAAFRSLRSPSANHLLAFTN